MEGIQVRKSPPPSIVDFLAFGGKPANVFVSILSPSNRDQIKTIIGPSSFVKLRTLFGGQVNSEPVYANKIFMLCILCL